jgi:3-hydroxyacyl-CoA dehydrogenase/3a,7a,12a-trihydroxy-5b-cholest-24-enoyl-CoA hydratase
MAAVGGFDKPILHGLCSFGFAVRHVLRRFGNNDPTNVKSIKVRFTAPVFPGETLETSMWQRGNRVHFQTRVVERNVIALSNPYVDLVNLSPAACPAPVPSGPVLKSVEIFEDMKKQLTPELVSKIGVVYQWNITKGGKQVAQWTTDLTGQGKIYSGPAQTKAGCTLTLDDDDLVSMATGKLDSMKAFMAGKLKIAGNVMLAQKLKALFDSKATSVGPKPTAGQSDALEASKVIDELGKNLTADLVKSVGAIYQWNITKDGKVAGQWTLDLKNGNGSVYEGPAKPKADCTLTMADADFVEIFNGKLDPMKAFMGGKLKIAGNIMLSQKLKTVFDANRKKIEEAAATFALGGGATPAAAKPAVPQPASKNEKIFTDMKSMLGADVVKKVNAVYQWNIVDSSNKVIATWTSDLKNGAGSIYPGAAKGKADCTLTLSEETLEGLVSNTLDSMKAFMAGKLKIAGNVMLAQKLKALFPPQAKL